MDSEYSQAGVNLASVSAPNFAFAFNNKKFSDRVLLVEIIADLPERMPEGEDCSSISDWTRNRKRRRKDIKIENGSEGDSINDLTRVIDGSGVLRVNTVYISSLILAAQSPFFYKLFSNGMIESGEQNVTLRIHASEEAALTDLLGFMYNNALTATTAPALLDVLMIADKYEVTSCISYCTQLLCKLPMTCESALFYLDFHSTGLVAKVAIPLMQTAKLYLADRYKEINKFHNEVLDLPLAGIEAVLSSDALKIHSEDAVFDFVLKWAKMHYPKPEERREVIKKHLTRLIRFPFMTTRKLQKILKCDEFNHEFASEAVLEALLFKSKSLQRHPTISKAEPNPSLSHQRFVERSYIYRPVKVIQFESPTQQCIVYLDLKREECKDLQPGEQIYSQSFHIGRQGFHLSARCTMDRLGLFNCFGLYLVMQEKGLETFPTSYEFAARSSKEDGEFVTKSKGFRLFTRGKSVGYRNLFLMTWAEFLGDDNIYFINGVLHLRAAVCA